MKAIKMFKENQYDIFEKVSTMAGAVGMRMLLKKSWKSITSKEPPENPASPTVPWKEALLWGAATGLTVGIIKIVTRRAATASWSKFKEAT